MDVEQVIAKVSADPNVGSSVVTLVNEIVEVLDSPGSKKDLADALNENANELADAVVAGTASGKEIAFDPTNPTGVKRTADGQPLEEIDVTGVTAGDAGNRAHDTVADVVAKTTPSSESD